MRTAAAAHACTHTHTHTHARTHTHTHTRAHARRCAHRHTVTANIISPGTFPPNDADIKSDAKFSALLKANPSGRLGRTEDIGGMVAYLCSENGGFVKGQMLQINGGVVMQF